MSEENNNNLVWFRKELVSNRFMVGGQAVPFEVLDRNRGVIGLDQSNPKHIPVIDALNAAAHEERGGIVKITHVEAEELKKNFPPSLTPKSKKDVLRAMPDLNRKRQPTAENGAAPVNSRLAELAQRPLAHQDAPKTEEKPVSEAGKPATRRISMEELQKQALTEEPKK